MYVTAVIFENLTFLIRVNFVLFAIVECCFLNPVPCTVASYLDSINLECACMFTL